MGRLVEEGLLETNIEGIVPRRKPVPLDDALWAGTVEPRIMELLPAVLVKKPRLLRLPKELPQDVAEVIHAIRHGKPAPTFRGVHRVLSTTIAENIAPLIDVAPGSHGLLIKALGFTFRDQPISYQTIVVPETPYELEILG